MDGGCVSFHAWGEPQWTWSEDGQSAEALFTCMTDGATTTLSGQAVGQETTPATCTESGITTYTVTVQLEGTDYSTSRDVADIEPLGHSFTDYVYNNDATFEANGNIRNIICINQVVFVYISLAHITFKITITKS